MYHTMAARTFMTNLTHTQPPGGANRAKVSAIWGWFGPSAGHGFANLLILLGSNFRPRLLICRIGLTAGFDGAKEYQP